MCLSFACKMSENNIQPSSFPVNEYIDIAGDIRIANRINGQHMDQMFEDLVTKAQEYRTRWMESEARVDSLKNVIAKQWNEINLLYKQLNDISKKLHIAESTAQSNATKYNRMYGKLKSIILDTDDGEEQA